MKPPTSTHIPATGKERSGRASDSEEIQTTLNRTGMGGEGVRGEGTVFISRL